MVDSQHPALHAALELQRRAYRAHPAPALKERCADLRTLKRFVLDNQADMIAAVSADYGCRSQHETLITELVPVVQAIRHARKHLKAWMRPRRRAVDLRLFPGARNRVLPQPLGVIGVIVPWNFPVNLSLIPLVAIFAAGNRAMIKFSENSQRLASLFIERLPAYFPGEKLAVFAETGAVGQAFSRLPLDHLLFTGSAQTGRAVMAAAAGNLCPVTLELGGKSPALLCEDFPLRTAVERIMFVKLLNAGQICTTVDYLLLPAKRLADFVALAREVVPKRYASLASPDYTAIIDQPSFERLTQALLEAEQRGARLISLLPGERWDAARRKINPQLVLDAPEDCQLLQREIFGPILPLRTFESIASAVDFINARPRPLAFYPFSRDRKLIQRLIGEVMSGGVAVNDALYHVAQDDLPFGGVGPSGMGHYHGIEGFLTFSKLRPIFEQARFTPARLLWPPYGALAERLARLFMR